jgi:hypothetical protein
MAGVVPVSAAPEPAGPGGITDSAVMTLIASVGDDIFSTTDLTVLFDPAGTDFAKHYGPYTTESTDSGTCGNDWANDTFDRHFTVHQKNGTITVTEQFKEGTFTTPATGSTHPNFSPGACQTSATPAGTVNDGVTGGLHGYFVIPLASGTMQTSGSPYCDANLMTNAGCDTATFINTHFSCTYFSPGCSTTTFFFHYAASDQDLILHEWKNASTDRGGNSGDIRSNNIP